MTRNAQIFVGCGGSGLNTLRRINQLLSQDNRWRHRLGQDIYYIAVDTNEKDLNAFEKGVKDDCRGIKAPYVGRISLGQGLQSIYPRLQRNFIDPFNREGGIGTSEGKNRLEKYWWHDEDGRPFEAGKVRELNTGAGQCPPVSYFLAWDQLKQSMADTFSELQSEITSRSSYGGNEGMKNVNFSVIAGLAGGTGRGCWELVAFGLRDLFREKACTLVTPMAYLLDATCYRKCYHGKPSQEIQMKVNSLTGFSQVSTWIRNVHERGEYVFRLPSMRRPQDEAQDVIKVALDFDPGSGGPVHKAYIVCDGNSNLTLDSHEQYQEMLGTAIYAGIAQDELTGERINEPNPIAGIGAASIEVPAVKIRRYLENYQRHLFNKRLSSNEAYGEDVEMNLLEELQLTIPRTLKSESRKPGSEKTLIGYAYEHLKEKHLQKTKEGFIAQLGEDQPSKEEAIGAAKTALKIPEAAITEAVSYAKTKLQASPIDGINDKARDILRSTGSLTSVAHFYATMADTLENAVNTRRGGEDHVEVFSKSVEQKSKRPWYLLGPKFDEEELEALKDDFPMRYSYVALEELRASLRLQFEAWATNCRKKGEAAKGFAAQARLVADAFAAKAVKAAGCQEDEVYTKLFCDPEKPENALPAEDSETRFYQRLLKPMKSKEEVDALLPTDAMPAELCKLLVDNLEKGYNDEDIISHQSFRAELERETTSFIGMTAQDLEEEFDLVGVAKEICHAWHKRLQEVSKNTDKFEKLCRRFHQFFGFKPAYDDARNEVNLFPGERIDPTHEGRELIARMGVEMAAHCWPYWNLDPDAEPERKLSFYLPAFKDEEDKVELSEAFRDHVSYRVQANAGQCMNPFVALAYTTDGVKNLDHVTSLGYYKDNPEIAERLSRAEDPSGALVFDQERSIGGQGYTNPIYVNEPDLSDWRWKPWVKADDSNAAKTQRTEALDALVYALMMPTPKLEAKTSALGGQAWSMPLIEIDETRNFNFARRELEYDENETRLSQRVVKNMNNPAWTEGDRIANRIDRVLAALLGEVVESGPASGADGSAILSCIKREQAEFWHDYANEVSMGMKSELHRDVLRQQMERFNDEAEKAKANSNKEAAEVWTELRERVNELLTA
jgi:hypothetical protein